MATMTSSSFTYEWTYDVFLSFRGEDTRMGFTGYLYNALREKGIKTFFDDQELRKGKEITAALMKAIRESRIAIVILSQNYASSTFCLEELVNIMDCIKHQGRLVWPVFYKVDPSDVRHQKGSYAEALSKHTDTEKVKRWRLALKEVANLSGLHFNQGYEYEFIEKISQEVSKKINRTPLYVAQYPVGLESRIQKIHSLLDVESNDGVYMIGIYGIGGIGKTTLACAVYNFIADQFEGLSFLADIREESVKHGLVQLQETLLYDIVGEKDIKLGHVKKGIPIIKSRLCKKKVLLILDDVNRLEQLKVLAGGLDWFGSGSRIIITTRDIHLLHVHGVERTYEVEGLNDEEALELFSWNAFKREKVNPIYMDISKAVILNSNGLPLSLEIIGSDLFGKKLLEWKSALDAYERIPHENIQEILRISYDGLKEFEKIIFLDLACCFNGFVLRDVIKILHNGRGLNPDYFIQVLIEKCLIKVVQGRVRIHNLVENMGREIVRQESPSKPGERSRIWFSRDILHVFEEDKGSDKTEIIMLNLPNDKEVQWDGDALKKMENLKVLVIENARFSKGPNHLPISLRVLKWHGYPEPLLPAHFNPKKLALLELSGRFFTLENQLTMKFKSLNELKLVNCQSLKQVPDMSGASNLMRLQISNCRNLVEVHDSVGFLDKLKCLCLEQCTNLRVLPHGINLPSLLYMSLNDCASLQSFPEVLGKMENLKTLKLKLNGIRKLPFSISNLVGLKRLYLCGEGLLELRRSIFMLADLPTLDANSSWWFAQMQKDRDQEQEMMSSNLITAGFEYCNMTEELLTTLLPYLQHISVLDLTFSNITVLPSLINACISLRELRLDWCLKLREIKGLPRNIEYLSAMYCSSLNAKSKEMLLGKTLHENGGKYFCIPGSAIPGWFGHSSRGRSLCFWFRNKFPAIIMCVGGSVLSCECKLIINGIPTDATIRFRVNHIVLFDLLLELEKLHFDIERINIQNGWNRARLSFKPCWGSETVHLVGIHVQEQKTSMADIQFTNPEPPIVQKQKQRKQKRNAK